MTGLMGQPDARIVNVYDWTPLLNEFQRDFPDVDLRFKVMEPDEFQAAVRPSAANVPDVAFLNNASQTDPLVKADAILQPPRMGFARFPYNGWWTIFRRGKNPEGSRAFALWLVRSPGWKPWPLRSTSMGPADVTAVQAVSREAVRRLQTEGSQSFAALMDPLAQHFEWPVQMERISALDPLVTFGDSRLAFELVSAEGEGHGFFGMSHSLLILRKAEDGWKVLLLAPGRLPSLERLLQSFDHLGLADGPPDDLGKVTLVSPMDHAQATRWPPPGQLEWTTAGAQVAQYVLEWQFGQPRRESWSTSTIQLLPPAPGQTSMSMKIPFGKGVQPHRWRVWAVGKTGAVSLSEWRTIDFAN